MNSIEPDELARRIAAGTAPLILDVRSRVEYHAGHVPGARHLPFWTLPWRGDELRGERNRDVVVYCGHGPRAMMAAAWLRQKGFTNVRLLSGHWTGWRGERVTGKG
jgi:rhodanese-related sulfurtransferase